MFHIRDYRSEDLLDCVQCFYEGFFHSPITAKDMLFLKDYTQILIERSNFAFIAECDGRAAGFICGVFLKKFDPILAKQYVKEKHLSLLVKIFLKYYFKKYPMSEAFREEFELFFAMVQERTPSTLGECDCELAALTSLRDYRKGVGTALVDKMVDHCRQAGAGSIRLFTNTFASYSFYSKYGFSLISEKEFRINRISGKSFVYEYLI